LLLVLGVGGAISGIVFDYENALAPFTLTVVTGGSSGIGKAFISMIAEANPRMAICNLSRRAPEGLSPEVCARLLHVPCDLGKPELRQGAAGEAIRFIRQHHNRSKTLLINNSGFGSYGYFSSAELATQLDMLQVNVAAPLELTSLLLPELRERGGAVINVASVSGFQSTPYLATYGATKAFVLHWSLALHEELRPHGIPVQALCPGPTRTEIFRRAGLRLGVKEEAGLATAEAVVRASLRGLARGRPLVVPGWRNKILATLSGALPRALAARLSAKAMARYRLKYLAQPTEAAK
jgi:short-subunit dehydrogenase